jgi:hypothetical protein
MEPTTAPFKHLDKLIAGRPYAQLATEITEAYRNIGIKLTATE